MDGIMIVDTLFSIAGAAVSYWQATRANNYRDEVLRERRRRALSDLLVIARRAREECRGIMTPIGKSLRGIDPQKRIDSIRGCIDRLKEDGHQFRHTSLTKRMKDLEERIRLYVPEVNESTQYRVADGM